MKITEIETATTNEVQEESFDDKFTKYWLHMHTPYKNDHPKIGRNEICPFCDSGKKFKNCECYKTKQSDLVYDFSKTRKLK